MNKVAIKKPMVKFEAGSRGLVSEDNFFCIRSMFKFAKSKTKTQAIQDILILLCWDHMSSVCGVAEQISAKILHLVIQATNLAHMLMMGHLVQKQR